MEMKLTRYYNWPVYWYPGYDGMPGGSLDPGMFPAPEAELDGEPCNVHLQSVKDIIGYHVQAKDGSIGHIADFILDDKSWLIRYLVIDTRNWIPGRKVLIPPDWSSSISWAEGVVTIEHTREEVQDTPPYDHSAPVNRELEEALYDYYGRPKYWL